VKGMAADRFSPNTKARTLTDHAAADALGANGIAYLPRRGGGYAKTPVLTRRNPLVA
jgi:hypothetical protein